MNEDILYVPYNGTIKLLNTFQKESGRARHKDALRAVLFLSQAMVEDAGKGLIYSVSDRMEGRVNFIRRARGNLSNVMSI